MQHFSDHSCTQRFRGPRPADLIAKDLKLVFASGQEMAVKDIVDYWGMPSVLEHPECFDYCSLADEPGGGHHNWYCLVCMNANSGRYVRADSQHCQSAKHQAKLKMFLGKTTQGKDAELVQFHTKTKSRHPYFVASMV